jgi:hypothetical protein
MTTRRSMSALAAALVLSALPLVPPATAAPAAPAAAPAAAPPAVCAGGPTTTADAPPAPPSGPGACRAQAAARTAGPDGRRPADRRPVPTSGYHHLGGQTSNYGSVGIFGALNVVNPSLVHGTWDFLANRVMAKSCDSTRWLELGWAEVGWRNDAQYIYSFNTVLNQWQFFDQYPIGPGSRIYVTVLHVGNGQWEAQLWWNGMWNTLVSVNPGPGIGCGNEQYVEVYTAGTGRHFPFPTITVGDGGTGGMNIADSNAVWHTWDASIPTFETNNLENYYLVTWLARYFSWQVRSSNSPPSLSFSVSPSQGTLTTSFFASASGSFDPNGDSVSYRIDWGDGASTFASSGSHTYSSTGTKVVTLTGTDQFGASSSTSRTVRVCAVLVGGTCL